MKKMLAVAFLALLVLSTFSQTGLAAAAPVPDIGKGQVEYQNLYGVIDQILSWYFYNLNIDDLKINGSPKLVPGIVGNSVYFNGQTDYLVIAATKKSNTISHVELAAWVKPNYTDAGREMTIIEKDKAFSLKLEKYGLNYHVSFSVFNGIQWTYLYSNSAIGKGWTNISVSYDGSSMSIYINGGLDSQKNLASNPLYHFNGVAIRSPTTLKSDADIYVGASGSNLGIHNMFNGALDEVQFFLTPSLILQEKAGPTNMTSAGTNQTNASSAAQTPLSLGQFSNATGLAPGQIPGQQAAANANESLSVNDTLSAAVVPSLKPTPLANGTLPINETVNVSDEMSANTTRAQVVFNYTNATVVRGTIPNATELYQFTSPTELNATTVGKVETRTLQNVTSLSLGGEGYLHENGTSTSQVSSLTVSAWVKPDFSKGSSQFTVVGKERSFILSVNNGYPPAHVAKFLVFDGIRWHKVESNVTISENWTHLVGTFNGTKIAIYVNGTRQNSADVGLTPTFNIVGQPALVRVGNITSSADVVIGAYQAFRGDKPEVSNLFSGDIGTVSLYTSLLNESQIQHLYLSSPLVQRPAVPQVPVTPPAENYTGVPVTPQLTATKKSFLLTERPEFSFEFFSDSNLQKLGKPVKESRGAVQNNGWNEPNATISIKVTDPSGKQVPLNSKFMKMRAGKFDIQLDSLRSGRAGTYKVEIDMVRDGKTYTSVQQFQWGLVSLNTEKSIYRPGETASFVIVVLDNEGHAVCNSNIVMSILDPQSRSTVLTTGNGISQGASCGLYDANYTTSSEGNYTVNISAQNPSGVATFSTSFLVSNSFDFDIVRTADSKIDPVNNPNSFVVRIDVRSFTNASNVTIREAVPSVFNVTTDASVQTVGDTKVLTWNRNLAGNSTSVSYAYSVPLIFPQLYALGPVEIDYGNKTFTEARQWYVANDPHTATSSSGFVYVNKGTSISNTVAVQPGLYNRYLVAGVAYTDTSAAGRTISVRYTTGSCPTSTNDLTNLTATAMTGEAVTTVKTQLYGINIPASITTGTITVCVTNAAPATAVILYLAMFTGVNETNPTGDEVGTKTTSNTNPVWGGSLTNDTHDALVDLVGMASNTGITAVNGEGQKIIKTLKQGAGCNCGIGMSNKTGGSLNPFGWTFGTTAGKAVMETAVVLHGLFFTKYETMSLSDSVSANVIRYVPLSESLSLSDNTVSTTKKMTTSLNEPLSISDNTVSKTIAYTKALDEPLAVSDNTISKTAVFTKTLNEPLAVSDNTITTGVTRTNSLNESLALGDEVTETRSKMLDESLSLGDSASMQADLKRSFNETVALGDNATAHADLTRSFNETVALGDSATAEHVNFKSVNESLALGDSLEETHVLVQELSESLSLGDGTTAEHVNFQPVNESLAIGDSAGTTVTLVKPVNESLSLGDSASTEAQITTPLNESLAIGDSATASHMNFKSVNESMAFGDNVGAIKSLVEELSESLALGDTAGITVTLVKPVNESLSLGDSAGTTVTLVKPVNESLSLGDSASTRSDLTRSFNESLAVGDSSTAAHGNFKPLNDSMTIGDTMETLHSVVNEVSEPLALSDAITTNHVNFKSLNESMSLGDAITTNRVNFKPVNESMAFGDSAATLAEIARSFNETVTAGDTLTPSRNFTSTHPDSVSVTDSVSAAQILEPDQKKVSPIDTQVTVSPVTPRLVVTDQNIQLSSIVIPSTVSTSSIDYSRVLVGGAAKVPFGLNITKDTNGDNKPEVVVTIFPDIITGPSWNGILTLPTIQAVALNITPPSGQTTVQDTTLQIGSGTPLTFENATRILFVGESGHQVGYYHGANQVDEITTVCTGDNQAVGNALPAEGACKIEVGNNLVVWTKHLSGYVTWHFVKAIISIPTFGAGPTTVGISGAAVPSGITMVPPAVANLTLYQVSYNVCPSNVASFVIGTKSDLPPKVNVITGSKLVQGNEAAIQPFAEYDNMTGSHIKVYQAALDPKATTMTLTVINQVTGGLEYVQRVVNISGCQGTEFVNELPPLPIPQSPKIFGVSTSIGNETQAPAETAQYVSNKTLSVYALVTSNSMLHDAQVRFTGAGQNATGAGAVNMTVVPQANSSAYLVNGTIQTERLVPPYTNFWIWARSGDGLVGQSSTYSVGVVPSYSVNATVSLDVKPVAAQGSLMSPIVYVQNNSTGPIYGSVSLVVNGTMVSQSPGIAFGTGTSAVQLGWIPPMVYHNSVYSLSARGEFYGTVVQTGNATVETFPASKVLALSDLGPLGPVTNETGGAIGEPTGLYSSFENPGNYAYKVTSPDGTCVIGQDSGCLVSGVVMGNQTVPITVAGQNYAVQYTGPDAKVQRFTISSNESFAGQWNVAIERSGTVQQDMMSKVLLKITYSEESLPATLVSSR